MSEVQSEEPHISPSSPSSAVNQMYPIVSTPASTELELPSSDIAPSPKNFPPTPVLALTMSEYPHFSQDQVEQSFE